MTDVPKRAASFPVQALVYVAVALGMLGTYYTYDSIAPVAEMLSRQLGFSDLQIGSLNAIYSLPNIFLPVVGGMLIDRFGARTVMLMTAATCVGGAILTALGAHFAVMLCGRLLFGIGAETLFVSISAALAQWFIGRHFVLLYTLNVSLGRVGSYLADRSPSFAHSLYHQGWQPPLWLAVGFAGAAFLGAIAYWCTDRDQARRGVRTAFVPADSIDWGSLFRLPREYWYLIGVCVAFYSVIFTFRSTFAIKFFQETRGLSLEDASRTNSYVFLTAIIATPLVGLLADRIRRDGLLLVIGSLLLPASFLCLGLPGVPLWLPTALLGASFSMVPAILWPSVAKHVAAGQRGTAIGLATVLQQTGLTLTNLGAGYLNDRAFAQSAQLKYTGMLWFFGVVSLAGFIFAMLLKRHDAPSGQLLPSETFHT